MRTLNWKALIAIAIAGLLAAAGWQSRAVYRSWKANRYLQEARELASGTNLPFAWSYALQAVNLSPDNPNAYLLLAGIAQRMGTPQELPLRIKVSQLTPGVASNLFSLAEAALRFEGPPYAILASALDKVPPADQNSVIHHFLSAALALKRGQIPLAEKYLESARALDPTNQQARLNLAVLRLRGTNAATRAAARTELEILSRDPTLRLAALRSLVASTLEANDLAATLRFSEALLREPECEFGDRIVHLQLLRARNDPTAPGWLARLKAEAGEAEGPIIELARWLIANGSARDVVDWLEPTVRKRSTSALDAVLADSYAHLRQWPALEQFLRDRTWPDRPAERLAWIARAQREDGRRDVADANWSRALREADDHGPALAGLLSLALSWGWVPEQIEILWQVCEKLPGERWAVPELAGRLAAAQSTAEMHRLFKLLHNRNATDPVVQNNLATTSLLLGIETNEAHLMAARAAEGRSSDPGFATTLAFSLERQGKAAEAWKLLSSIDPKQFEDPSRALYYGLVLAANARGQEAREYLETARQKAPLPQERQLASDTLARLK